LCWEGKKRDGGAQAYICEKYVVGVPEKNNVTVARVAWYRGRGAVRAAPSAVVEKSWNTTSPKQRGAIIRCAFCNFLLCAVVQYVHATDTRTTQLSSLPLS